MTIYYFDPITIFGNIFIFYAYDILVAKCGYYDNLSVLAEYTTAYKSTELWLQGFGQHEILTFVKSDDWTHVDAHLLQDVKPEQFDSGTDETLLVSIEWESPSRATPRLFVIDT